MLWYLHPTLITRRESPSCSSESLVLALAVVARDVAGCGGTLGWVLSCGQHPCLPA